MANTFKFGNGEWAVGKETVLAYNDENNNFKPLPFTFDRASTATVVNKDGLIETVGVDEPRIDFLDNTSGHLLLEPSRTNLATYSEALSNLTVKSGTFTDNFAISPDGSQNATKITATNTDPYFYQNFTFSSTTYTMSIYVKGIGNAVGKDFQMRIAGTTPYDTFQIPSEWTRFTTTKTVSASTSNFGLEIPDTAVIGDEVLVWGWQLEVGSYATSYIPTSGSSVTRSAETANGAGNSTVFNDSEGVLYVEIEALANDLTYRGISIGDGTANNVVRIYYENVSNRFTANIKNAGVSQATMIYTFTDITVNSKIAVKYKQNDFALWVNGTEVATDSSGSAPTGLDVLQFDTGTGGDDFYGKVKDLRVYNTALSDSELQALTS